jgi:hypothetical protein
MSRPAGELERERRQPVAIDPGALRNAKPGELAIRFAFGAAIALTAGLVGLKFGPRVGGVLLAFPALLPASLTLMEKKDGREKADIDAVGASLGSCGMVAFAIAAVFLLPRLGAAPGVLLAAAVWAVVSVALFYIARRVSTPT